MDLLKKIAPRVCMMIALITALGLGIGVAGGAPPSKSDWVAAWGHFLQGLAPTVATNQTVRVIARPTISRRRARAAGKYVRHGSLTINAASMPIATTARNSCRERSAR
jgi:hypothetical protein